MQLFPLQISQAVVIRMKHYKTACLMLLKTKMSHSRFRSELLHFELTRVFNDHKKTKMVSISAVAACAKADLVTEDFLKEVGLEVFQLSIKAESDELSREEGFLNI